MFAQVSAVHHHIPSRRALLQFATRCLFPQRCFQSLADGVQLVHGQDALDSQHQAILRQCWIENLVLIS
jgi:hypothetical protein